MSLSKLGNATEIGEELNRQYRMPFDNKFGLAIWSGIVTLNRLYGISAYI